MFDSGHVGSRKLDQQPKKILGYPFTVQGVIGM